MAEVLATRWYVDECAVETRVAKLVGGRLVSLKLIPHVMPGLARPQIGEIYLVRATKAAPGMRGQFVDLGDGGEGFLRTKEPLPEGEFILARVAQSAYGSKAPVLKPEEGGAFAAERRARRVSHPMSAAQYLAAHAREGERILVDSDRGWHGPPAAENAEPGLFETLGIEAQIEAALEAVVLLPGGARLIVEQTQALTAIDVDARAALASDANAEAARAIPYQIAARALAGNIVIDFAQINRASDVAPLRDQLAATAKTIGLILQIGVASRTGLLELQRARTEPPLAALLTERGMTHSAVPTRLSLWAQAARLARSVRLASSRMPGGLDLHVGAALHEWLMRGAGAPAWAAMGAASAAPLHLIASGLDDAVSIERRARSMR